jgi:hypothetical protein
VRPLLAAAAAGGCLLAAAAPAAASQLVFACGPSFEDLCRARPDGTG